jgi:hypothetical protein
MRLSFAAPLASLLACHPLTPDLQRPPPGPGGLTLTATGTLDAGDTLTLRVTGAAPGGTVLLARSATRAPAAACPAALGGLCLDLLRPTLVASLTADSLGRAQRVITAPATLPDGAVVWFQAAQPGSAPATSAAVPRFNPRDTNAAAARRDLGAADVVPGVSFQGELTSSWVSIYDPRVDVCRVQFTSAGAPFSGGPACTGCTFAFTVQHDAPTETSLTGDCLDLLGLVPTSLGAFTEPIGLHESYFFAGYGPYTAAMTLDGGAWRPFAAGDAVSWDGSTFGWRVSGAYYAY